jgi:hypothetical protein
MRASDPSRRTGRVSSALVALVSLVSLFGLGCSSAPEVTVEVTSTAETNGGRPFYAVTRSVEQTTYITDTYEGIAARIFATPPDPTILKAEVIYPGVPATWTVEQPEGLSVGVYFMFTDPGDGWKIVRSPPLPTTIEVELGVNSVATSV